MELTHLVAEISILLLAAVGLGGLLVWWFYHRQIAAYRAAFDEVKDDWDAWRHTHGVESTRVDALEERFEGLTAGQESMSGSIQTAQERADEVAREVAQLEESLEALPGDVEPRFAALTGRLNTLEKRHTDARRAIGGIREEAEEAEQRRLELDRKIGAIRATVGTWREPHEKLDRRVDELFGQVLAHERFGVRLDDVEKTLAESLTKMEAARSAFVAETPSTAATQQMPAMGGVLPEALDGLEVALAEQRARLEELEDAVRTRGSQASPSRPPGEVAEAPPDVTRRIEAMEAEHRRLLERAEALQRGLEEAETARASLDTRFGAVDDAVSTLRGSLERHVEALREQLTSLRGDHESLRQRLAPLDALVHSLGNLGGRLDDLDASLNGVSSEHADLAGRFAAVRIQLAELTTESPGAELRPVIAELQEEKADRVDLSELLSRVRRLEPDTPDVSDADRPASLLPEPLAGPPDDLKVIRGIGPKLERLLHDLGIYYYEQIASFTDRDVAWVDAHLDVFQGRVLRDEWVAQAKELNAIKEAGGLAGLPRPVESDSP
ncbi:MAG: hypothetical protein ACFCGT_19545 [Sandaracinaceae bacterium]